MKRPFKILLAASVVFVLLFTACGKKAPPSSGPIPLDTNSQINLNIGESDDNSLCPKVFTKNDAQKIFGGEWGFSGTMNIGKGCTYPLVSMGGITGGQQIPPTLLVGVSPDQTVSDFDGTWVTGEKVPFSGIGDKAFIATDEKDGKSLYVLKGTNKFDIITSNYKATDDQLKAAAAIAVSRLP